MTYIYGDNLGFARNKSPDVFKEYICAERNMHSHPYIALARLRVIYERYSDLTLAELKISYRSTAPFHERLKLLRGKVPDKLWLQLEDIRSTCNAASHNLQTADYESSEKQIAIALHGLQLARDFAHWFYEKIQKDTTLDQPAEFVIPPPSSFEEELRHAHDGDGYAALMIAKRHWAKALEDGAPAFHRSLYDTFLEVACSTGLTDAKLRKATDLIYLGRTADEIKAGISLNDELIAQGEVWGRYCDKACALASLNRELTGVSIARKGVEAGDPYAMNLMAQWAGYPSKEIVMTDEERAELWERSLEIAFNSEAAYYLSMFYGAQGRVPEAVELLEKAIHFGEDDRGVLEFQLGSLLIEYSQDIDRGLELLNFYASLSGWKALSSAEKLAEFGMLVQSLACFRLAVTSSMDIEIQQHIDEFRATRDALLSYDEMSQADLSFLVACLGE